MRRNLLILAGLLLTAFIFYAEWRRSRLLDQLSRVNLELDEALHSIDSNAKRAEALLKATPDAMVSFSDRGQVESLNSRMRELLGLTNEHDQPTDVAQFVTQLFACDTSPDRATRQHRLCTELIDALRTGWQRPDGIIIELVCDTPRLYELRLVAILPPAASLVVILRDITDLNAQLNKPQTLPNCATP